MLKMISYFYKTALLVAAISSFTIAGDVPRAGKRQIPADPTGVTTVIAPSGAQIRYKEPGKSGFCETTPGVNSYSGYVDLDPQTHMFFYVNCLLFLFGTLYLRFSAIQFKNEPERSTSYTVAEWRPG